MSRAALTLRWHPEWPVSMLVATGWLVAIALQMSGRHVIHAAPPMIAWVVMAALMMLPVTLPAIRHVAFNSFRHRRIRAMAIYLAVYLLVWIGFGVLALAAVSAGMRVGLTARDLTVSTLIVAALWQLAPYRQRAILGCRQAAALSPRGLRADAACAHFAVQQALHCMLVCWPAMLLMAIIGHHLAPMAVLTLILIAEEQASWRARLFAPVCLLFVMAAGITALR